MSYSCLRETAETLDYLSLVQGVLSFFKTAGKGAVIVDGSVYFLVYDGHQLRSLGVDFVFITFSEDEYSRYKYSPRLRRKLSESFSSRYRSAYGTLLNS